MAGPVIVERREALVRAVEAVVEAAVVEVVEVAAAVDDLPSHIQS